MESSSAASLAGVCAVSGLEFRTRPEGVWQRETGKRLIGNRGIERWQNGIEPSRDFTFVAAGNDQPERFALLTEIGFIASSVAVAWLLRGCKAFALASIFGRPENKIAAQNKIKSAVTAKTIFE